MASLAPTSSPISGRITELDALRGLAVIGIVWMNVYVFALPAQGYYNPLAWQGAEGINAPLDRIVWAVSFVFIEDKFRTLFAMLFGAGCIILIERASERGETRIWRAHYARMAVLFVIGFVHATLLASNDILRGYALAGCALPFLAHLSVRALVAISIGLVAIHLGGGIVAFGGAIYDWSRGLNGSDQVMFAERNFGVDPLAVQYALDLGRESFDERVTRRIDTIPAQLQTIAGSVPINLAAMTLGMALWKDRMLAGEWRTFQLQRLAAVCALCTIPCLLGLAWWVSDRGFPGVLAGPTSLILSAPFDTALGLAYAALAMALFNGEGKLTRLLAAAGRLSLSNYVMTSVILSAIFSSWGFGLFGYVSRTEALVISFLPIAVMLVWSPLWTDRMGQGPLERLWRGAAKALS
ncbi:MAG: DUF418 domain-containing protein [Pseudomonadota bacterium]